MRNTSGVAETVVEIHVPLVSPSDLPDGAYPFPWIRVVDDLLAELEKRGEIEVFDEGEEVGRAYAFFITAASLDHLLAVAARVAALPTVPTGAFAVVTDDEAEEMGRGRRVKLPSA
jgi:hypothetical protein